MKKNTLIFLAVLILIGGVALLNREAVPTKTQDWVPDSGLPEPKPVDDKLMQEVEDSEAFKAKVKNLLEQETLTKKKQNSTSQYELEKVKLETQLADLKLKHDAEMKVIEDELSKLREESVSFQFPSEQ